MRRRVGTRVLVVLAMAAAVLLSGSEADADVGTITLYGAPNLFPTGGIVVGPDGHLWFTNPNDKIGELDPATGAITLHTNASIKSPSDLTVAGGDLWFTNTTGGSTGTIGIFDLDAPTDATAFTFFASPVIFPYKITTAADGNVWVLGSTARRILLNHTAGASYNPGGTASDILLGPDDNIWITRANSQNSLLRVNPTTGALVAEHLMPIAGLQPRQLAIGPDDDMWFTYGGGQFGGVAHFDDETSTFQRRDFTSDTNAKGITTGPDGNLWFLGATQDRVYRISPSLTGLVSFGDANLDIGPSAQEIVPLDDDLWAATSESNDRIARISTVADLWRPAPSPST